MDTPVIACILASCMGIGAFASGITEAMHSKGYEEALKNPSLYYLVDDFGDPVSQEIEEPKRF